MIGRVSSDPILSNYEVFPPAGMPGLVHTEGCREACPWWSAAGGAGTRPAS